MRDRQSDAQQAVEHDEDRPSDQKIDETQARPAQHIAGWERLADRHGSPLRGSRPRPRGTASGHTTIDVRETAQPPKAAMEVGIGVRLLGWPSRLTAHLLSSA